jgi:hypothetical protein
VEELKRMLEEETKESRRERLRRWREWLAKMVTSDLKDTTGRLMALTADIARALDMHDPARRLLELAPRIRETLGELYIMLGQIQGELANRMLWERDVADHR